MSKIIKEWFENGKIQRQYIVDENNIKDGDYREWDINEKLIIQCSYVQGKIVGTKKFFNASGDIEREIDYEFEGNPFVIKFYADEFTEKEARIVGLAYDIEHLTLHNILESFKQIKGKCIDLAEENLLLKKEKEGRQSQKDKEQNLAQLASGFPSKINKEIRVTFS